MSDTLLYSPKKIIKENILLFILLAIATLVLYGNTLGGDFLTADDVPGIVNNPMVVDFKSSMATWELEKIYPAVLFKFFGMKPLPYHIFSISLHFINCVLVFVLVSILFGKAEALITTLIFLMHPINTEAVSWISAYGYLVYTAFTLTILISYILWFKTRQTKYLVFSIASFLLCLVFYRKPWVALIPVYIVLIDQLILEKKIIFSKAKYYLLFLIPTIIYFFSWVKGQLAYRSEALITLYYNDPSKATPYFNRVLYTVFETVKLFLWPQDLTIYHEGEKVLSLAFFTAESAVVSLSVVILVLFLIFKKQKIPQKQSLNKTIGALVILIYATMGLSFYFEVVVWAMAERYLYLASVFFGIIVALLYTNNKSKSYVKPLLVVALIAFAGKTMLRTQAWKTSKNLWIETQKVSPYSYRVYNNLGDVYSTDGNYQLALKQFQTSLQLNPGFADAVHNIGYTYYQMGDVEHAKMYLLKSYEMNPNMFQALYKLGVISFHEGDVNKAKEYFEKAYAVTQDYEPINSALNMLNSIPKGSIVRVAGTTQPMN